MRTTTGDNVSKEQRILLRSASTLAQKEKVGLQRKRRDIKRNRQRGLRHDREVKHETNEYILVAPEGDKLHRVCGQARPLSSLSAALRSWRSFYIWIHHP